MYCSTDSAQHETSRVHESSSRFSMVSSGLVLCGQLSHIDLSICETVSGTEYEDDNAVLWSNKVVQFQFFVQYG